MFLKKAAVVGAIALSAALTTEVARAVPVAPYDVDLGREARWALDANKFADSTTPTKFVYARCYRTEQLFEAAWEWNHPGSSARGIWAYAVSRLKTIYLRPSTCRGAWQFMTKLGRGQSKRVTTFEVGSYATVLHEALHVQGVHDERRTECLANDGVRWAVMSAYDTPKAEANRLARMAFSVSAKYATSRYWSVSGECQRSLADTDWTDYID